MGGAAGLGGQEAAEAELVGAAGRGGGELDLILWDVGVGGVDEVVVEVEVAGKWVEGVVVWRRRKGTAYCWCRWMGNADNSRVAWNWWGIRWCGIVFGCIFWRCSSNAFFL